MSDKLKYATEGVDLKDFKDWLIHNDNSFFLKHRSRLPHGSFSLWMRRVDHAHEDVRKLLGGQLLNLDIEIGEGQSPVNLEDHKELVANIMAECADFFNKKGFNQDILKYPTHQTDERRANRVSKMINKYYGNRDISSLKYKRIQDYLSQMGDVWNRYKNKKRKGKLTVSTTAKGFVLLGHYGPDKESCYREGSTSVKDKYVLSQTKDTIVITYAEQNEEGKWKNICRSFGFIDVKKKEVHVSNCYSKKGLPEGDIINIYKKAFEQILNKKLEYIEGVLFFDRDHDKVYANEFGRWSFITDKNSYNTFNKPATNLYGLYTKGCPITGRSSEKNGDFNWLFVDDKWCSPQAQGQAFKCVVSGILSFKQMKRVIGSDGEKAYVHPDYYDALPVCEETGEKCSSVCITPEGTKIAEYLFDDRYEECDSIGEYYPKEEMVDLLGYTVSQQSIDSGIFPFDDEEMANIIMIANKQKENDYATQS